MSLTLYFLVFGLNFLGFGLTIWRNQKIELLHHYHYKHVLEKDKPAYCAMVGKAMVAFSLYMLLGALVDILFQKQLVWLFFLLGFAHFFLVFAWAQRKYNDGKWFR